ncbi:MAG: thioesterase family protein [Trebonia sp.]
MGTFEFDAATALSGNGPVFGAVLDGRWDGQASTNGGFMLSLATRAVGEVLPFPDPIVVSGFYLRPGSPGPAEIRTEVIRAGRTTAFGQASLYRDDKEVLRATAAYTSLDAAAARGVPLYSAGEPPDQPPPGQCQVLRRTAALPITLVDRIDYRVAELPSWVTGAPPSGNPVYEGWMRFTDGREPDLLSLPMFVDAVAPAAFEIGLRRVTTVELTVHLRARPAPGWLAFRTLTRYLADGYHEEDAELWDSTGRLVAQSRQLALVLD